MTTPEEQAAEVLRDALFDAPWRTTEGIGRLLRERADTYAEGGE